MSGHSVPKIAQPRFLYPGNSFNPPRQLWLAMMRGWQGLSPCCGHSHRLGDDHCEECGQSLAPAEFDGAIALFAIPLAFAMAVLAMLGAEELWLMACEQNLPIEVMGLIGLFVATIATLALHRRIAGALLGLQWALWMHGFDPDYQLDMSVIRSAAASTVPSTRLCIVAWSEDPTVVRAITPLPHLTPHPRHRRGDR